MCDPLSAGSFALSAGSSLASYGSQKAAARARNRAKIRNYKLAVEAYHRDVLLANAEWKDSRTQTEINLDNLFQQTADRWQQQDAQIAQLWDQQKFDQFEILRKMLGSESAREQTGVSAMRIAGEPIRKAGYEITKRYQQTMQKADDAFLQKQIFENDANRQRRVEWHKTWRSPVPGFAPEPEPLEAMPSMGSTLLNIALAGVTSGISAFQIHKAGGLGSIFGKAGEGVTKTYTGFVQNVPAGIAPIPSHIVAPVKEASAWSLQNVQKFLPIQAQNIHGYTALQAPVKTIKYSGLPIP